MLAALPALTVALTLLVVWPSSPSPFHEPKTWSLALGAALAVLATVRRPTRWQWTALPLVAVTTLQGGPATIAFAWALVAWPALPLSPRWAWRLLFAAVALGASVVVLQALGLDVLGADSSGRLKTYGTLGNPDFVASVLLPLLLLMATLRSREATVRETLPTTEPVEEGPATLNRALTAALVVVALALTRSFATVASFAAGASVLAARRPHLLVPALVCGVVLAAPLVSRDPSSAIAGRAYLVGVALPHVVEAPLTGLGPGAVEQRWPTWELEWWKARCDDAACVEAHPQGRFAGLQDHLHADWLEWLLERGVLGLCALVLALAAPLRAAWSSDRVVFAALVAALVRSFVDFPLERPADLAVIALLSSLALRAPVGPSSTGSDRPG